jgi:hypothetical protein
LEKDLPFHPQEMVMVVSKIFGKRINNIKKLLSLNFFYLIEETENSIAQVWLAA